MTTHEALARSAIAGDRAALERLTRALLDIVYPLALRCLVVTAEAEDATQEIVVTAITHLSQFEFRSTVKTWVTAQALRTLSRWSRKRAMQAPTSSEAMVELIDLGLSLTHPTSLPEGEVTVLAREVQLSCTQGMLAALTEAERLAYVAGAILGATDTVGAELLGVSPESFRQRLSRARARMKPLLEQRCGLVNPNNPCRCERQAAAKQKVGPIHLRFVDSVAFAEANEELGEMLKLGRAFRERPPLGAPKALWDRVRKSFPRLTGGEDL